MEAKTVKTLREIGNEIAQKFKTGETTFEAALNTLVNSGFNQDAARVILYTGRVGN